MKTLITLSETVIRQFKSILIDSNKRWCSGFEYELKNGDDI